MFSLIEGIFYSAWKVVQPFFIPKVKGDHVTTQLASPGTMFRSRLIEAIIAAHSISPQQQGFWLRQSTIPSRVTFQYLASGESRESPLVTPRALFVTFYVRNAFNSARRIMRWAAILCCTIRSTASDKLPPRLGHPGIVFGPDPWIVL